MRKETDMTKIENKEQYEWAVARVEQLLPLVDDTTPRTDPNSIELELLSNLVADYPGGKRSCHKTGDCASRCTWLVKR